MKRAHFGLLEAAFILVLVILCLFCPFFSSPQNPSVGLTLFALAKVNLTGSSCLASFVFLPLFFLWSVAKVLFSLLLTGKREAMSSFILYLVWAALGLGYLVFISKDQAFGAFLTVLLFTSASIPFSYLERRFFPTKE